MIGKTNAIGGVSAPVPKIRTVSGSVISISDALAMPAVSLAVDIDPVQDLHGYDAPWVGGAGKNKLDIDALITAPSGTFGGYTFKHKLTLTLLPNTRYTLSTSYDGTSNVLYFNGVTASGNVVKANVPRTFQSSETGELVILLYDRDGISQFENKTVTVQLEEGDSVTSYAPFSNICPISGWSNVNVYREAQYDAGATPYATINLNGTRYGGSLDVVSGVGTLIVLHKTITAWSGVWGSTSNGYAVYTSVSDSKHIQDTTIKYCASNMFEPSTGSYSTSPVGSYGGASGAQETQTFILPSTITSRAEADSWLAGLSTPLECTFPLATPLTIQLTPTQVQMLLGNNTLWADSGDTELQYWARR